MKPLWRAACGAGLALLLQGCPTREFYLIPAEPPWDRLGPEGVAVPAFGAAPEGWSIAEQARGEIVRALERGAVPVTTPGQVPFELVGSITDLTLVTVTSPPRRILRAGTNVSAAGPNVETWVWEQEVEHAAVLKLAIRLERGRREVLWQRSGEGRASRSSVETLAWPGSDPLPPPRSQAAPPEPNLVSSLRRQALTQALAPVLQALTDRYDYRTVP